MMRIFASALMAFCLVVIGIMAIPIKAHARALTSWDLLTAFEHCAENGWDGHDCKVYLTPPKGSDCETAGYESVEDCPPALRGAVGAYGEFLENQ